jgi:hypothetical protein
MMRYEVQNRYQDEGWEYHEQYDDERFACDTAEKMSYQPLTFGMSRVLDTHTGEIVVEYPEGSKGYASKRRSQPDTNRDRIHSPPVPVTATSLEEVPMQHITCSPFIVWSPQGPTNPKCRFHSEPAARRAAEDMARKHPGQEFFVMKAVGLARQRGVEYVPVVVTEVPF